MYLVAYPLLLIGLSLLIPFCQSILSLGGLLLVSTLVVTLLVGGMIGAWYSFIAFLIYVTGLLVLFGYMLAMSSNNFYPKYISLKITLGVAIALTLTLLGGETGISGFKPLINSSYISGVVTMYSGLSLLFYWLIALILFLALVMAVNLCYKSPKPLRSFLNFMHFN